MSADRKPLSIMVRQPDHVRFGVFATDDVVHPLLMVEEGDDGDFDLSTGRLVPFAEAFSILQQINGATRALN